MVFAVYKGGEKWSPTVGALCRRRCQPLGYSKSLPTRTFQGLFCSMCCSRSLAMVRAAALGSSRPRRMLAPFAPGPVGGACRHLSTHGRMSRGLAYPCLDAGYPTLSFHYRLSLHLSTRLNYLDDADMHVQSLLFARPASFVTSFILDHIATLLIFSRLLNYNLKIYPMPAKTWIRSLR